MAQAVHILYTVSRKCKSKHRPFQEIENCYNEGFNRRAIARNVWGFFMSACVVVKVGQLLIDLLVKYTISLINKTFFCSETARYYFRPPHLPWLEDWHSVIFPWFWTSGDTKRLLNWKDQLSVDGFGLKHPVMNVSWWKNCSNNSVANTVLPELAVGTSTPRFYK